MVDALLAIKWSPEQIVGYLKLNQIPTMSHETLYQYIWSNRKQGDLLWKHLR
ncbi:IS1655 transposase [Photobacterium marinum]|uniref:IS1655 transposase n=1 Tax=Photobacterium marinum TaxID=1056511 RepID=L8JGH2_9GAMM|nr:IS1655 transposase [Photobacterium marinum]